MSKSHLKASCSLVDILRTHATRNQGAVAYRFLVDGDQEGRLLTYGNLDQRARVIATLLKEHAAPGQCALLLYPQGLDFLEGFFGCLYNKTIAVPAYSPHPAFLKRSLPRILAIVKETNTTVGLTTTDTLQSLLQLMAEFEDLRRIRWLTTDNISVDSQGLWQETNIDPETIAFIQYTSGSTGNPKGVILTHGNLIHQERSLAAKLEWGERAVVASWLPVFHDMGLIGNALQPLYMGGEAILMSPFAFLQRPCRWLNAVSKYRATCSTAPNFAYQLCVDRVSPEEKAALDLSQWEIALCGSEPIRKETLDRFADAFQSCGFQRKAFFPCFGLAEATLMVSGGPKNHPLFFRHFDSEALQNNRVTEVAPGPESRCFVGCGEPLIDQSTLIVNPNSNEPAVTGSVGEIWLRGPSVSRGYWQRPIETQAIFDAHLANGDGPFLRTGDLGFFLNDQLFIAGRLKDLIIIRGKNHYPQDIEFSVQQCHPFMGKTVATFAVIIEGEERLVIAAEVERRHKVAPTSQGAVQRGFDPHSIFSAIRTAVSDQHNLQVHAIALLKAGSLPKTSSGKIQRRLCRELFISGQLEVLAAWPSSAKEL